jgi:hypothetical protein
LRPSGLDITVGAACQSTNAKGGGAAMSLQDAIQQALNFLTSASANSRVEVTLSMLDDARVVLYGIAVPVFNTDLPPLGAETATLATDTSTTTGKGGWFTRQPTPGFSTRGDTPGPYTNLLWESPDFGPSGQIPMQFSVRRDPGVPILRWVRGGPTVQIEIEASGHAVTLNAVEDGAFLRAVGASVKDPARRAYYVVTFGEVMPIIL